MSHLPFDIHEIDVQMACSLDDATIRRAALYVAGRARDVEDARLLLAVLGIIAGERA